MNLITYPIYLLSAYYKGYKVEFFKFNLPIIYDCDEEFRNRWVNIFGSLIISENNERKAFIKCDGCEDIKQVNWLDYGNGNIVFDSMCENCDKELRDRNRAEYLAENKK